MSGQTGVGIQQRFTQGSVQRINGAVAFGGIEPEFFVDFQFDNRFREHADIAASAAAVSGNDAVFDRREMRPKRPGNSFYQ